MNSHQAKGTNVQGKLPCGNPRRYGGRDVVCMSKGTLPGNKNKAVSSAVNADDSTKTEAELHLQRLLEKQMRTDVTLSGHFLEHRTFSEATKHRPGVDELIGVHGYEEYKLASDLDAKIDFLRHCGLNDEEIAIKMKGDMGLKDPPKTESYGPEPESQALKLEEIERKIAEKEKQLQMPHATKGALLLTRQRLELEASHSQRFSGNGDNGSSTSGLIIKGTQIEPEASHPDDPINHIPNMLTKLEGKVMGKREPRRDRRRKRKLERRMQYYKQFEGDATKIVEEGSTTSDKKTDSDDSDADVGKDFGASRLSGENVENRTRGNEQQVPGTTVKKEDAQIKARDINSSVTEDLEELPEATCAPRPPDWVSSKPEKRKKKKPSILPAEEVEISSDTKFLSKDFIAANRLSTDEIKKLPKFDNYSPGDPNRVLYVKNLPSKTTAVDLMELFGCLQKEDQKRITLRLLAGRMKGQAFVTLPDEVVATETLNLVNGFLLHGSPVIVSFGRKA